MPYNVPSALATHIAGELTTLCTLWTLTRRDGTTYRYTDHDKDVTFNGALFLSGVGYDRSAIEDKMDMSVDNMDIKGIIDGVDISRADIRAGLFDGATVTIDIINYEDPSQGAIRRRTGWLGNVKQNNLGSFDAELRGLAQALSEGVSLVYTPACPVDLGSTKCQVAVLNRNERLDETAYAKHQWVWVPEYPDYVWRCITAGTTNAASDTDLTTFDVGAEDVIVADGSVQWQSRLRFDRAFTVLEGADRKRFTISITEPRLLTDTTWFNDGALIFSTGPNASVSKGVKTVTVNTDDTVDIELHLRLPATPLVGNTGTIIPGCQKTVLACGNKFGNVMNFRGHPYIPGENYLKFYPNAK